MISIIIQIVLSYISNTAEYPDRKPFIVTIYSWFILRKKFEANVTKLDQPFFIYLDRKYSNDAIKLRCLIIILLGISHVGKTLKNFMQLGYFIARLYSNIYAFFTLTYTRECANKLQVLTRTQYTGIIAFNRPVSLCFFSGSEFSLVAFHPGNANAFLPHFSLCYR